MSFKESNKTIMPFLSGKYCNGYTLVEVLVSASIFMIIIAGPTGIFVSSLKGQNQALALRETIDNTSHVIDYMTRALRMARKDDIGGSNCCLFGDKVNYEITHSGQGIVFTNYNLECQEFFLEDGQIKENKGGNILPLTSSDLEISSLSFNISGEEQTDNLQPRVTFSFTVSKKGVIDFPAIPIQTTVSQRNLDVLR